MSNDTEYAMIGDSVCCNIAVRNSIVRTYRQFHLYLKCIIRLCDVMWVCHWRPTHIWMRVTLSCHIIIIRPYQLLLYVVSWLLIIYYLDVIVQIFKLGQSILNPSFIVLSMCPRLQLQCMQLYRKCRATLYAALQKV